MKREVLTLISCALCSAEALARWSSGVVDNKPTVAQYMPPAPDVPQVFLTISFECNQRRLGGYLRLASEKQFSKIYIMGSEDATELSGTYRPGALTARAFLLSSKSAKVLVKELMKGDRESSSAVKAGSQVDDALRLTDDPIREGQPVHTLGFRQVAAKTLAPCLK